MSSMGFLKCQMARVLGFTPLQGFTPFQIGEWEWLTPFLEWSLVSAFFSPLFVSAKSEMWVKKKITNSKLFFHPFLRFYIYMGEKKVFYMQIFFFTQKHEFGWKKSFLYRNLFFHPISRFQKFQKFSKVWHENGWKKSFLFRYLFFHPVFRIQKLLYGEVGEKKDFIYKTLFSPSFMLFKFLQIL